MMNRVSLFVLFVSVAVGVPVAAFAEDQATIDEYYSPWANPRALTNLRHLATCVVDRHGTVAQEFVRQMGSEKELRARSKQLIDDRCLRALLFRASATRVDSSVYYPMIAEALLMKNYSADQLPPTAGVGPLEHPSLPDVPIETVHPHYRDSFVVSSAVRHLQAASECAARVEPELVFALAQTEPESTTERQALSSLDSILNACGAGPLQYSYPAFVKRGALVANLYRLVDAARHSPQPEPAA